jgi:hypothetical protein
MAEIHQNCITVKPADDLDEYGQTQKKALRLMKALRDWSPELAVIRSYVLKTILLHEVNKVGLDWRAEALAERVLGMLAVLRDGLEEQALSNVFESSCNELQMSSKKAKRRMETIEYINHLIGVDGREERLRDMFQNIHDAILQTM